TTTEFIRRTRSTTCRASTRGSARGYGSSRRSRSEGSPHPSSATSLRSQRRYPPHEGEGGRSLSPSHDRQNKRPAYAGLRTRSQQLGSALAGLVALVDLGDDVDTAAAADELVGAMATHQSLERIGNLHSYLGSKQKEARRALNCRCH